ncbi:hypothetical protein Lal_00021778, partial [Lupinus albus]
MAIERVYIAKNTSHTEDRILVHELENILIIADPTLFEYSNTIQYYGAYAALGVDSRMRLDNFRENFKVEMNTEEIIKVPTMAIERVYIAKNTSHTEDRILVHELETILIIADPRLFEYSFTITIESTGALPPETLFTEAVKILEEKCER